MRLIHVLIRPQLSPYTSTVSAKLQDPRPSPSFTKLSIAACSFILHAQSTKPCVRETFFTEKLIIDRDQQPHWSYHKGCGQTTPGETDVGMHLPKFTFVYIPLVFCKIEIVLSFFSDLVLLVGHFHFQLQFLQFLAILRVKQVDTLQLERFQLKSVLKLSGMTVRRGLFVVKTDGRETNDMILTLEEGI